MAPARKAAAVPYIAEDLETEEFKTAANAHVAVLTGIRWCVHYTIGSGESESMFVCLHRRADTEVPYEF